VCGSPGWRLRGDVVDSGTAHLRPAESWLAFHFNLTRPGGVAFAYSLACPAPPAAGFDVFVDGVPVLPSWAESTGSWARYSRAHDALR
jgi:hypothetical protein